MATPWYTAIAMLLLPLALAQSTGDSGASTAKGPLDSNLNELLHSLQVKEEHANATLVKLAAYIESGRSLTNNLNFTTKKALTIEKHAADKLIANRVAAQKEYNAKLSALVTVSVKETDMKWSDAEFDNLRTERTDLMNAMNAQTATLERLTGDYENKLKKEELCDDEKLELDRAHEIVTLARTAVAGLPVLAELAEKLETLNDAGRHEDISGRVAKLQKRIEDEDANSKYMIQSLSRAIAEKIDGVSGGCQNKGDESEDKQKEQEDKKKEREDKRKEEECNGKRCRKEEKKDEKKEKKEEKKEEKESHRHGKGKRHGKGHHNRHDEEEEEVALYLVDASGFQLEATPENLVAPPQSTDIATLKKFGDQAAHGAQLLLGKLGNFLETSKQTGFDMAAARRAANAIEKRITADFTKRRTAILGDLEQQLQSAQASGTVDNQYQHTPDNAKYDSALAAMSKDMDALKQMSADATKTPTDEAGLSEKAEKDRASDIVSATKASSQAMLDSASATLKLQETIGMNETIIKDSYTRIDDMNKRIVLAAEDAGEVADILIEVFYTAIKKYVDQDVALAKRSSESQKAEAGELLQELPQLKSEDAITNCIFWGGLMLAMAAMALMVGVRGRQRSSVINSSPLLG